MHALKPLLATAAVTFSQLALAAGTVDCKNDEDRVVCEIVLAVTAGPPCNVALPDVNVKRDSGKWTVLLFRLDTAGYRFVDDVYVKRLDGSNADDVFEKSLGRKERRRYLLIDKNPSDEDFKYDIKVKNAQHQDCTTHDPTIHNQN